jgi:hypothetical protein
MMTERNHHFSFVVKSFIVFLLVFLSACQTGSNPAIRQTEEFYINDRPGILLNATKWTIFTYGEELYEDSKQADYSAKDISGAQVVVTTYLGDSSSIDTTEIFNAWGIGENDMGILITLFFSQGEDEYIYNNMIFEIGERMAGHLSAFTADGLISTYFNDTSIPSYDYDQRLISLYFGVMEYLYLNVYDYQSYDYQSFIDEYALNKYDYLGPLPSDFEKDPLPVWAWILIIFAVVVLGVFPSRYLIPLIFGGFGGGRGGGGRSGGYWFRR